MPNYTAQSPLVPRVPDSGRVALTYDLNPITGIWVSVSEGSVEVEVTPPFLGQEKREPMKLFVDKEQMITFCENVLKVIKAREEVDKWLHEKVKSAIHNLAATDKVKTMYSGGE